jgi:hypothetical protein
MIVPAVKGTSKAKKTRVNMESKIILFVKARTAGMIRSNGEDLISRKPSEASSANS